MTFHGVLQQIRNRVFTLKHRSILWKLGVGQEQDYKAYLDIQFQRTLSKKHRQAGSRTSWLVDRILDFRESDAKARVLCIGCRNTYELEYFRKSGFRNVMGIDLYSENSDILVMDMHEMTFSDNCFDIIYSSHSLEHAYNPHKVAKEIIRIAKSEAIVAIEVPVKYETRGADRLDFENLDSLHALFSSSIHRVLWSEELPPCHARNEMELSIIRTIFSVNKGD